MRSQNISNEKEFCKGIILIFVIEKINLSKKKIVEDIIKK